jgi:hypothetical protein
MRWNQGRAEVDKLIAAGDCSACPRIVSMRTNS